jgi:hypothetical protein
VKTHICEWQGQNFNPNDYALLPQQSAELGPEQNTVLSAILSLDHNNAMDG